MFVIFYKKLYVVLILSSLLISCSRLTYQYQFDPNVAPTTFPDKIYVEDQVYTLNTQGQLAIPDQKYIEIRLKDGKFHAGKLINIQNKYIILSEGLKYYKDSASDKHVLRHQIKIPKEKVLILKMW